MLLDIKNNIIICKDGIDVVSKYALNIGISDTIICSNVASIILNITNGFFLNQ